MKLTRMVSAVMVALLLVGCLLMGGCSTPEIAMVVGGKTYTTADYLAYVYSVLSTDDTVYNYLYYLGSDALKEKIEVGEEDDKEEITIKEYILREAQESMIRQAAVSNKLAEYNLEWDKEKLADAEKELKELETDAFLPLGFNNQRYIEMYKALNLNETSLFYGLYDEGGERAVPEADIRKYFDDNYASFKIIEISLMNKDESEMKEAEVKKIEARLQKYLDAFNATEKNGADFDKTAYALYLKDEEEAKKASTTTKAGATTTTKATTTTTTTASTTASSADTTTSTTAANKEDNKTDSTTSTETVQAAQRYDMFKDDFSDEDLFKAIRDIEMGSAAIKTYKKGGTDKTMALIFRMDPEKERTEKDEDGKEKEVDYYKENRDSSLEYMKYDEYDEEIEKAVEELKKSAVIDERAMKSPDLKEMIALLYGV
ncbi:MAG: hypothetical protein IJO59_05160 [Clostridia bacterium]|nr:hypothetical protein [Clostridia bacterium]